MKVDVTMFIEKSIGNKSWTHYWVYYSIYGRPDQKKRKKRKIDIFMTRISEKKNTFIWDHVNIRENLETIYQWYKEISNFTRHKCIGDKWVAFFIKIKFLSTIQIKEVIILDKTKNYKPYFYYLKYGSIAFYI